MSAQELKELFAILVVLVFSLSLHEVAHGWTALKCGDPTARDEGRITLNPLPHIDFVQTILLPAFVWFASKGTMIFGGARPVPVDFHRLRHPWRDMALVAVAGPATNALLAVGFYTLLKAGLHAGLYERMPRLDDMLRTAFQFNVLLAVFNLLPIPPLDGSRVAAWLLPDGLRPAYLALERMGLVLVIVLVFWVPPVRRLVEHGTDLMAAAIEQIVSLGGAW